MDLVKAKKVLSKNFKDHNVKADVDEETLLMFCCVDLIREDMETPSSPRSKKKDDANVQQ